MASRVKPSRQQESKRYPSSCIKYSLVVLNIMFWLLSIVIILVGAYIIHESKDHFQQLADLKFQPSIFILIVGCLIFLITFIGCIGALRENETLLRVYCGIIAFILLIMVASVAVVIVFRSKIREPISNKLKSIIPRYRDDGEKNLDLQNLIDAVQKDWACCGVDSYKDWEGNEYFNCSAPLGSSRRCGVPLTCCKKELQSNRQCGFHVRDPDLTGNAKVEALNRINTVGCVEQGISWLTDNWAIMGGIVLGIFILQLIAIFLGNRLINEIHDIKKQCEN